MPDAFTNTFQTTLLIMYFATPAETMHLKPGDKPKYETTKVWTLQSTNQIPTENPNMCVAVGTNLIHEFDLVSTVTVRAYCLCPENVTNDDACFKQREQESKAITRKGLVPVTPPATILRLGPSTTLPNTSGAPTR
jgi:hypothetical protein